MKIALTFTLLALISCCLEISAHDDLISLNEDVLYYPDGKSIHIKKQYYVNFDESFSEKILHGSYETYYHLGSMNTEEVYFHGQLTEKKHWNIRGNLIYHRVTGKESGTVSTEFTYYDNSNKIRTMTIMTTRYQEGLNKRASGIVPTVESVGGYHQVLLFDTNGNLTETVNGSRYLRSPEFPERIRDLIKSKKKAKVEP